VAGRDATRLERDGIASSALRSARTTVLGARESSLEGVNSAGEIDGVFATAIEGKLAIATGCGFLGSDIIPTDAGRMTAWF